jgi:hypothetical protein
MAQREIIFDRVVGIELSQRVGDLFGGRPRGGPAIGQSEVATDSVDVRVDGNH